MDRMKFICGQLIIFLAPARIEQLIPSINCSEILLLHLNEISLRLPLPSWRAKASCKVLNRPTDGLTNLHHDLMGIVRYSGSILVTSRLDKVLNVLSADACSF